MANFKSRLKKLKGDQIKNHTGTVSKIIIPENIASTSSTMEERRDKLKSLERIEEQHNKRLSEIKSDPLTSIFEIDVNLIRVDPDQPRKGFDQEALQELANSIKEVGLVLPIVVSEIFDDPKHYFQIKVGERRWRAHKLAGIKKIKTIINNNTQDLKYEQYVENANRVDLTPFEEAHALNDIKSRYGVSNSELAKKVGKSKTRVTTLLSILPIETIILTESVRRRTDPPADGTETKSVRRRTDLSNFPLGICEELARIREKPYLSRAINLCFEGISQKNLRVFIKKEEENLHSPSEKSRKSFKTLLVSTMGEEEKKHMKSTNVKWNQAEKYLIQNDSISNDISELELILWCNTEESVMREHLDLLERKLKIVTKIKEKKKATPHQFDEMLEKLRNLVDAYRYIDINIKYLIDSQSVPIGNQKTGKKKIMVAKAKTNSKMAPAKMKDLTPRHIAFFDHINEEFSKFEGNYIDDVTFQSLADDLSLDVLEEQFKLLPFRQGSKKPAGVFVTNCNKLIKGVEVKPPRSNIPNKNFRDIKPFSWDEYRSSQEEEQLKSRHLLEEPRYAKELFEQIEGARFYFAEMVRSTETDLYLCITADEKDHDFVYENFSQSWLESVYEKMVPGGKVHYCSLGDVGAIT